ncbi:MAG TPA: proton extrusion protein PcxA [Leptolyngbyaceae cyanobacterium]
MKNSFYPNSSGKLLRHLYTIKHWFLATPERALDQAYKAALTINSIEDEYFNGHKISAESANYSNSVMLCLQAELKKNLSIAKRRLAEFKASLSFVSISNHFTLEKIKFIDEVIDKYSFQETKSLALVPDSSPEAIILNKGDLNKANNQQSSFSKDIINVESISDKTGVLPRSIGRTINRIKTELKPQAEEEVIKKFQTSSAKTTTAVRFIFMLIIVPILAQQLAKQFLFFPIVERVRGETTTQIFLNYEMEEEAFRKLHSFEESLKFASLVNNFPKLSPELMEERVKHKANEIVEEFRRKSNNAISNVFADLIAVIAFVWVIVTRKREFIIVKSFIDDVAYGLSDSAKAFIIILMTDIFVGFHSPHGWEVILEGMAEHLGVPANKSMISLFIATFPVILDSIFKYWIFRYLSRISPSALATLKNMNE